MTDEEVKALEARSRRNREARGQPIYPKWQKEDAEAGTVAGGSEPGSGAGGPEAGTGKPEKDTFHRLQARVAAYRAQEALGEFKDEYEVKRKKPPKYRNTRTEVDGLKFDSKHEAQVYQGLMLRKEAGEIRAVVRQPKFDLPGGITYYADFAVVYPDNRVEFWDAKSEITKKNRVYINKRKQVAQIWGIEIVEV